MAHYAFLDDSNIVIEVITGIDEDATETLPDGFDSWEAFYLSMRPNASACKRTSYNTRNNQHLDGGSAFRGNYAGIGFTYDSDNDVFYEPKPYASWTLNSDWEWVAPIDKPSDYDTVYYYWDEDVYQADTSDPKTEGWVQP